MATVINNPPGAQSSGTGSGIIIGVVLTIIILALLVAYGFRSGNGFSKNKGTNFRAPDKVDVNVKTPNTNRY